jgi:prepilin signal peptidase PulO-like enzyme (type II secretory pathway)
LFTLVCGLVLGAIINWLADALPTHQRLGIPKYPDGSLRKPIAWLGLGAWLSGKRTSTSGVKLSWRHPAVELGLTVIFMYIALAYPVSAQSVVWLGTVAILMLITVIDLEHRLILFVVIIPAWGYTLIGSALTGPRPFQDYLIGGALGFGLFFMMYLGGALFSVIAASSRGEPLEEVAFGYGDVLLATLAGFMIGWSALIFAIFITVFTGAAGAIIYLAVKLVMRNKYEMFTALPYGQYIVLGTLIMLLWREPIFNFLQGR